MNQESMEQDFFKVNLSGNKAVTPPPSTEQDYYNSLFNTLLDQEEFTFNTVGVIMSSNLEAVCITGYEEWEVIGKHFSIFYTQKDVELNQPSLDLNRAQENGIVTVSGWRVKKKDKEFWADIKIQVLLSSEGETSGYKMTLHDAAHQMASNSRLKRLRNEYLNLFNNSFIGIYKFRFEDSCFLLLNEKATEILDCASPEPVYFYQLFEDATEYEKLKDSLKLKRKVLGFEFQLKKDSPNERWVSISCRHFSEGNFVEGIVIDITQNKKHILELERLNQELDGFTYHASHDLRSPLTSILGLLNLIELEKPSNRVSQYASMIQDRIFHLDNILKDLVSITYNSKSDIQYVIIDFDKEIKLVLTEFQTQFDRVQVFFEKRESCVLYSDLIRVRALLRNLISNGLTHQDPFSVSPFLKIVIETNTKQSVISFEDNGLGISAEYSDRIFDMFFRASADAKGSGLGLFIAKSIVTKLNGTISVRSEIGKGSVFTVVLPNRLLNDTQPENENGFLKMLLGQHSDR